MSVAMLPYVEQNWEGVWYGDFTRGVGAYSSLLRRKGEESELLTLSF